MSTDYELKVAARDLLGTGNSRRARKNGMIPAIIYSKGQKSTPIFVKNNEWEILSHKKLESFTLVLDDTKIPVTVKEVQANYLKGYTVHIDFYAI